MQELHGADKVSQLAKFEAKCKDLCQAYNFKEKFACRFNVETKYQKNSKNFHQIGWMNFQWKYQNKFGQLTKSGHHKNVIYDMD